MANEITTSINVSLSNGYLTSSFAPGAVRITQNTGITHETVWIVGTSEEDLAIGDLATLGYAMFRNLDTTNYVQIGMSDAGTMKTFARLKPGEPAAIRLEPGITVRAKANTASCKVQVKIFND